MTEALIRTDDLTWCRCLILRCNDCGFEGNQHAVQLHTALNPRHLVGTVVKPLCGETPCVTISAVWNADI